MAGVMTMVTEQGLEERHADEQRNRGQRVAHYIQASAQRNPLFQLTLSGHEKADLAAYLRSLEAQQDD